MTDLLNSSGNVNLKLHGSLIPGQEASRVDLEDSLIQGAKRVFQGTYVQCMIDGHLLDDAFYRRRSLHFPYDHPDPDPHLLHGDGICNHR